MSVRNTIFQAYKSSVETVLPVRTKSEFKELRVRNHLQIFFLQGFPVIQNLSMYLSAGADARRVCRNWRLPSQGLPNMVMVSLF